jgi:hypothetical protein
VTIDDQQVSFTGTMRVQAELDIPDALDLEAAVAAGAEQRTALGSTERLDVRRAQAVGDLARGQTPLDLLPGPTGGSTGEREARGVAPRQVVLYLHLAQAALAGGDPVVRLERGNALVTAEQVRAWCGRPDTHITVKPVLDLDACTWSSGDRVTPAIAEKVAVRDQTCVFPWCARPARRCRPDQHDHPCDNDHAHPPPRPGRRHLFVQHRTALCRRHHRLKTHSPWNYVVVDPGT